MECSEQHDSFLLEQYRCSHSSLLAREVPALTAWHVPLPKVSRHARAESCPEADVQSTVEKVTAGELMRSRR